MQKLTYKAYLCFAIAFTAGLCCAFAIARADEVILTEREQVVFNKINEVRERSGLARFILCPILTKESRDWSTNMQQRRLLYHGASQEICAQAQDERAFYAWRGSPPHNAFLFRRDNRVGIGSSDCGGWWTMRGERNMDFERTVPERTVETTPQYRYVRTGLLRWRWVTI
jgi:hypothetical protein